MLLNSQYEHWRLLTSVESGSVATLARVVWTQKVRQVAKLSRSSELSFESSHLDVLLLRAACDGKLLTLTQYSVERCIRSRGQAAPPLI